MAQPGKYLECCTCYNPLIKHLEDTQFTDEVIRQLSDSKGRKSRASEPVSVMYTGGTIRPLIHGTVDKVDAIGFHSGRVVASGSQSKVVTQMNNLDVSYSTITLSSGQTLVPGLIEPHVHIVPTAMMLGWNDFGPFEGQVLRKTYDLEWLTEAIQSASQSLRKGLIYKPWILGLSVDPSLMPFEPGEQGGLAKLLTFTCDDLDNIIDDVPLLMMAASGHTAYVNTLALQLTYDSSLEIQGNYKTFKAYRDAVVDAGGLQEIEGIMPAFGAIPKLQLSGMILGIKKHLDSLFETASRRGVTLMYDAAMSSSSKLVLEAYFYGQASSRVRIGYAEACLSMEAATGMAPYKPMTEFKNVYKGSVKLISDGSNQGLTGYQKEYYCCEPADNIGVFNFPPYSKPDVLPPEYKDLVKTIVDKGWPMMIHANGNKAIDFTIGAYKHALAGGSGLTKRHRIEHCSLLSPETVDSMFKLGISPSFLIGHVGYWGYAFRGAIFEEKAKQLDLCKSTLDKGMRITLHSDNAVSPLGPLRMMEQAITRIMEGDPQGRVLNPDERISPEQALRVVTYDAAWQCHADQWVGSLENGKFADYVILAEDPITRRNPVGMRNIPVLETWVGGTKMY